MRQTLYWFFAAGSFGVVATIMSIIVCSVFVVYPSASIKRYHDAESGFFGIIQTSSYDFAVCRVIGAERTIRSWGDLEFEAETEDPAIPSWSLVRRNKLNELPSGWSIQAWAEDARGWPFLVAMSYMRPTWRESISEEAWTLKSGFDWNDSKGAMQLLSFKGSCTILPTRVLWPGFAANVVFYASCIGALGMTFHSSRRQMRKRRGRCIRCGYPLDTSVMDCCPECGEVIS